MTPNNVRQDISAFASYLLGEGLAIGYHGPVVRNYGALSYVSSPWLAELSNDDENEESNESPFASVGEYLLFLQEGSYTLVLFDGALIQTAYAFERGRLTRHRLGYYPCPIDLDFRDGDYENFVEVVEDKLAKNNLKSLNCRSPLRFDFDSEAAREGHPASHVHMNSPDARVPAYGPVSFGHFAKFIFRNYYSEVWQGHEKLREWPARFWSRTVTIEEQRQIYFDCRQL